MRRRAYCYASLLFVALLLTGGARSGMTAAAASQVFWRSRWHGFCTS